MRKVVLRLPLGGLVVGFSPRNGRRVDTKIKNTQKSIKKTRAFFPGTLLFLIQIHLAFIFGLL